MYGLGQMQHSEFFSVLYVLSQMQYRDFFAGFSHARIYIFLVFSLFMVWFKCSTESSFLLFVWSESNAIQRLFSWLFP